MMMRLVWSAALLIALAGCGDSAASVAAAPQPAVVQALPGGGSLHRVTLSASAASRLGVQTQQVASSATYTTIPVTAVVYDPAGAAWTYVATAPLTYVRRPITVDHIDGDTAYLTAGPPAGTRVVTVGAPELLGAEYGVGEE